MAGSFPDVPSRRLAWDDDGTLHFYRRDPFPLSRVATWTEVSAAVMAEANDEDDVRTSEPYSLTATDLTLSWVFPELRELDGVFATVVGGQSGETATWAFNASDDARWPGGGVWQAVLAAQAAIDVTAGANYRDNIVSLSEVTRSACEIQTPGFGGGGRTDVRTVHLYGEISPGETPDRLLFIDDGTSLEFGLPIDYGDVPRGSSEDRNIRLRNNSATRTINTIQYTAEDLYRGSSGWYTFTEPGLAVFAATQAIASLAPATDTAIIVARRITPQGEGVGLHAARIQATVGSVTP